MMLGGQATVPMQLRHYRVGCRFWLRVKRGVARPCEAPVLDVIASLLNDALGDARVHPPPGLIDIAFVEHVAGGERKRRPASLKYVKAYESIDVQWPCDPIPTTLDLEAYRRLLSVTAEVITRVVAVLPAGSRFDAAQFTRRALDALDGGPRHESGFHDLFHSLSVRRRAALCRRQEAEDAFRAEHSVQLATRLTGTRIYWHVTGVGEIAKQAWWVNEVLGGLLRNEAVVTPGYREIYFAAAPTLALAYERFPIEEIWYRWTHCVWSEACTTSDITADALLTALESGLNRLIRVDHLDPAPIERAFRRARTERELTKLLLCHARSTAHDARVVYRVGRLDRHRYTLEVEDLESGIQGRRELGEVERDEAIFRFACLKLGKSHVRLEARKSLRANSYRGGAPAALHFSLSELLSQGA